MFDICSGPSPVTPVNGPSTSKADASISRDPCQDTVERVLLDGVKRRQPGARMDFDFTPAEEAFRAEVRAFLDENLPDPVPESPAFLDDWNRKLRKRCWVGFNWPPEHGGAGGSLI